MNAVLSAHQMESRISTLASPPDEKQAVIAVRGARVHNLQNLDVDIPVNRLTVITGVSGSGKSSLAFDTLYAEGQRRYIESLSAYARQFLERIERPDVDEIEGIAPAIAIRQKATVRNPRSTVATVTEIYDYLRLLFARVGRVHCIRCGEPVARDTVDEVVARILAEPAGRRFLVLFPLRLERFVQAGRRRRTGSSSAGAVLQALAGALEKRGFSRLWQGDRLFDFREPESLLDLRLEDPIWVVADRLAVGPEVRSRLADSIELCYREGDGEAAIRFVDGAAETLRFHEPFSCRRCGLSYAEPEPRLFSFNSPFGACPRCQGFGNTVDYDPDLIVPDKNRTLAEGAIEPWTKPRYRPLMAELRRFARLRGIPLDVPFGRLTPQQQRAIFEGDPETGFPGVQGFFRWLETKKYKVHVRVFLSRYRGYAVCPDCRGQRLRPEALAVRIGDESIATVCQMTVGRARQFFASLTLGPAEREVAAPLLEEIQRRLRFLDEVGLEYLTLDRLTGTLSGGEAQRIQLATSLGSGLVGALYVLDEPSVGLHPRDTAQLIRILQHLRDLGNTIVVVEHDPETITAADHILDLGPGAGEHGGRLLYAGPPSALPRERRSLTGRYLAGELQIPVPSQRRTPRGWLVVHGARVHNLKNITARFPLGVLTAVTGVSGSGKSTLLYDVLYRALQASAQGAPVSEWCDRIEGAEQIERVILVDQSPIGRTPRSNPATYLKAFDAIRKVFASTPQARRRGFGPGHFSFNIPGGRCETCQGAGTVTVQMQFLADVELVCEDCRGMRFKPAVLEITYRGKNIHDVLQMTVTEALEFFAHAPRVVERLRVLQEIGLGYLRLGQSATTLSGGEAQRLKLAAYLNEPAGARTLYLFDEPTTGLHLHDISRLLEAFGRLLRAGASVAVIEHNLDVIKAADWVIDLGPEGGHRGGEIVAEGPPETIAASPRSWTGRFLARVLSGQRGVPAHP